MRTLKQLANEVNNSLAFVYFTPEALSFFGKMPAATWGWGL